MEELKELARKYLELYSFDELLELNDITLEELVYELLYHGLIQSDLMVEL